DRVGLPLQREDMEVVGEAPSVRQGVESSRAVPARVSRPVNRAVDDRRLSPDVFHDVDLAARRPAHAGDVVAEHPERGPQALSGRQLDARLEASVALAELPLGLEPRGGVVARDAVGAGIGFAVGPNDERAVLDMSILQLIRVTFELVVAPTAAAGFA